jgi:hypothetical protein
VLIQPHPGFRLGDFLSGAASSIGRMPALTREAVGAFGYLDTQLPWPVPVVWGAMLAAVVVLGLAVGRERERAALLVAIAGSIAATAILGGIYRQTGFDLQARHLLPLWVLVPLLAGEVLSRNPRRLGSRMVVALPVSVFAAAAGAHLAAWYVNGRRFAVGTDGPWNFIPHAAWSPPAVGCSGCSRPREARSPAPWRGSRPRQPRPSAVMLHLGDPGPWGRGSPRDGEFRRGPGKTAAHKG